MTKHAVHSAAKRSLAMFVTLAMVLALLPVFTVGASAAPGMTATKRAWSDTAIRSTNNNSDGHTTYLNHISFDVPQTGDTNKNSLRASIGSDVADINTVVAVVASEGADPGKVDWYENGTDPTNMIGFNIAVPNTHTWVTSVTRKKGADAAAAKQDTGTNVSLAGYTYNSQKVNYSFGEMPQNFTKGGHVYLYTRPNEAKYVIYYITWATDTNGTDSYVETIAFDMTSPTLVLAAPGGPSPTAADSTPSAGTLGLDVNAMKTANSSIVGTWTNPTLTDTTNGNVAYELYVAAGAIPELTFKLTSQINTAYNIYGESSGNYTVEGETVVASGGVKGSVVIPSGKLSDRDVITFFTSATNYIRVRVCTVASVGISVGENGSMTATFNESAKNPAHRNKTIDAVTGKVNPSDPNPLVTLVKNAQQDPTGWLTDVNNTVKFTVTPTSGYAIDSVTVGGSPQALSGSGNNEFTLTFSDTTPKNIVVTFKTGSAPTAAASAQLITNATEAEAAGLTDGDWDWAGQTITGAHWMILEYEVGNVPITLTNFKVEKENSPGPGLTEVYDYNDGTPVSAPKPANTTQRVGIEAADVTGAEDDAKFFEPGTYTITITYTIAGEEDQTMTGIVTVAYTDVASVTVTGTAKVGETLTANVTPSGATPPLSYQWYRHTTDSSTGGTEITDATASTYTLTAADMTDGYVYAEVTGSGGTVRKSNVISVITPDFTLNTATAADSKYTKTHKLTDAQKAATTGNPDYDIYYTDAATVALTFAGSATGNITAVKNGGNGTGITVTGAAVEITSFVDGAIYDITRQGKTIKVRFYQVAKVTMSVTGTKTWGTVSYTFDPTANPDNEEELVALTEAKGYTHTELLDDGDTVVLTITPATGYKVKAVKNGDSGLSLSTGNVYEGGTYTTTVAKGTEYNYTVEFEVSPPNVLPDQAVGRSANDTLKLDGTTANNPGVYMFPTNDIRVKYQMYVPGDLANLKFNLTGAGSKPIKYKIASDGSTWGTEQTLPANGVITAVGGTEKIILFYTDHANWFKVHVMKAARVNVNVVGGDADNYVTVSYDSADNSKDVAGFPVGNGTAANSNSHWRDFNAISGETVTVVVTLDDSDGKYSDYKVTVDGTVDTEDSDDTFTTDLTEAKIYNITVTFIEKTFDSSNADETISGNVYVDAGVEESITLDLSTVAIADDVNFLIPDGKTLNITGDVDKGLTVSGGGDVAVSGSVTVAAEKAIEVTGGNLNVTGGMTVADKGAVKVDSGSNVTVGGTMTVGTNTAPATEADKAKVEVTNGGTLKVDSGAALVVQNAKLEVTNGGNLTVDKTSGADAVLTVGAGAELNVTGGNLTVDKGAELTVAEGAKVAVSAGSALTLSNSSNLTVTGSNAELKVESSPVTVTSGTLTVAAGAAVTLDGDSELTIASGSNVNVNGGSMTLGGGAVTGDGALIVGSNVQFLMAGRSLPSLPTTVTPSAQLNITQNQNIGTDITIHSNGAIVVAEGIELDVNKEIANGGNIVLGAGAILDLSGGGSVSGSGKVLDWKGVELTLGNDIKYKARLVMTLYVGAEAVGGALGKQRDINITGLVSGDYVYYQITEGHNTPATAKVHGVGQIITGNTLDISVDYGAEAKVQIWVFSEEPSNLTDPDDPVGAPVYGTVNATGTGSASSTN